ncbi:polysaccharide biosynthesis protein [Bacillus sp. ISL-41]|uniref:polysaccharide biosynthesis protein n=1 Tax=Bacillus sp. ISL-41 TaxID=2819127 RepID=UPI001BE9EEBC|nr:nucleoside-diphosphate sugar epimerase/dehydratase [Bacillus sp. ISL-41]MBT2642188.1 polysaccharide biosynthesis protein [Bacillus sp. ISL-41]
MTYRQRLSFFIFFDSSIVLAAIYFSKFLVDGTIMVFTLRMVLTSLVIIFSHHIFSFKFHLYQRAWEYASIGELFSILKIASLSIALAGVVQLVVFNEIEFRLLCVTWLLNMSLIGGSRFSWRVFRDSLIKQKENKTRLLIIGAGSAGTMVARQLANNLQTDLLPVAFIDDDEKKQKLNILGIPVVGGISEIEEAVKNYAIDNIIIAIPSLAKEELNKIFLECAKTKAKTQILPMLEDLMTGKISVNHFRDVQVEDLLGRETVKLDYENISENITNKVILVTGAGGSIGSEVCRQIVQFKPKQLILLGHGENSIYSIEMELKDSCANTDIRFTPVIADIQDAKKMLTVMNTYKPEMVYHAAAHKHVPLMECNPEEAVKNNIIGTLNLALAAKWNAVKTFVMISTDKAVNPTSVMGATKRLAEMIVQRMDQESETKFVAVRFGNVLGSRGSVIPLFKKQIEKGGPVTVTHPDMIRYFMTIPEASRLVLQAGSLAKGGEIFVLDMGEPVKIVDLAKNLIKLSGYSIDEIGIEYTGMRPGEKLFEELLNENEVHEEQIYPKIYVGKTSELLTEEIENLISDYPNVSKEELREHLLSIANYKIPRTQKMRVSV